MSDFSDSDNDDASPVNQLFNKATKHIQSIHGKLAQQDLIQLYGYYKQATCGKCNIAKPSLMQIQARAKWTAWNNLANLSGDEAKNLYIEKVKKLDPEWYKLLGSQPNHNTGWVVHSVLAPPDDHEPKADHEKNIYDHVKEGHLDKVKEYLQCEHFVELDEHGMGLIHWAADRNYVDILKYLLERGVNVNLRDSEQQTALHFASSCGNLECIRILLDNGADVSAKDVDDQTCLDVAENDEVRQALSSMH